MNNDQRTQLRRRATILQLQERNRGIEETLEKLQAELNLNWQIVIEFESQIDDGEEYSTSIESKDEISVKIIPSTTEQRPTARAQGAVITRT